MSKIKECPKCGSENIRCSTKNMGGTKAIQIECNECGYFDWVEAN